MVCTLQKTVFKFRSETPVALAGWWLAGSPVDRSSDSRQPNFAGYRFPGSLFAPAIL